MQRVSKLLAVVLAVLCLSVVSGCQEARKRVPRPPDVTVTHPVEREVTKYLEYTGTTQALE